MPNKTLVVEFQYFPPITLFKTLAIHTHVIFEQYENFQKRSFRNRMWIGGPTGRLELSIPLREGRNQKNMMKDVMIDNRVKWSTNHWRTLTSCYTKSPWFEFYRQELEAMYSSPGERLCDWNLAMFNWVVAKLGLKISASMTDKWIPQYPATEIGDWRNKLMPNSIATSFPGFVSYQQVFIDRTGFLPNLSILDLLFCEGRNALTLLQRQ